MSNSDCADFESAANNIDNAIRFDDIPRTAPLFADYLYAFEKVSSFYPGCARSFPSLVERARKVGGLDYDRNRVADALARINSAAGSPPLTFDHIEMLRRPGAVAIVTGQQAGLFTGPLYTILKSLTVVKLARCLREEGIEAVPVFWVASEDHDYDEVNHCRVIDREGRLKEITYDPGDRPAEVPVGRIRIGDDIGQKIDELLDLLPPSEFIPDLERDLRDSYRPGSWFAEAFTRLMARVFRDYGVVLLDPLDEALKQSANPLYAQAIEKSPEIARALMARSVELERAGYHSQIHVSDDMVPLFIMDGGRRAAMVEHDGHVGIKNSDRSFSRQELVDLARRCPACFSPNVTLRPVVQDYLLPTAAYIGGPAEIAYFAQLDAVYETLGRPRPCVLPRASMTLIEGRHQKSMRKNSLRLADFFEGLHPAVTKVVEQGPEREAARTFSETERVFTEQMNKLEQALRKSDKTLAASLDRARQRVIYQVEHLRTRFVHASAHREETTYRQVERAFTTLLPNKNLQERELNLYYFLSRYGRGLLNELHDAVEIGFSNHKLVYIGGVASQVINTRPAG